MSDNSVNNQNNDVKDVSQNIEDNQKTKKSTQSLRQAARKKAKTSTTKAKTVEKQVVKSDNKSSDKKPLINPNSKTYIYIISILLLISLISLLLDKTTASYIDFVIWLLFTIDVISRWVRSPDKKKFIGHHFFDFIAAIPFFSFFRLFKTVSLVLFVVRSTKLGRKYFSATYNYLSQTEFGRVVIGFVLVFIILPIPLVWIEPQMKDYSDVLWWAIQTTTTVGYGDIVPITAIGRVIGTILMLVGVGLIGTISSFLTRFFISKRQVHFKDYVDNISELSINEIHVLESKIVNAKDDLLHAKKFKVDKKHVLRTKKQEQGNMNK